MLLKRQLVSSKHICIRLAQAKSCFLDAPASCWLCNFEVRVKWLRSEAGSEEVIGSVLATVTRHTEGFWIHVDLDVVDSAEMPAVDCPEPDGPSFSIITAMLRGLLASPQCVGIEVTIYDPDLDPSGVYADRIVGCLTQALLPA